MIQGLIGKKIGMTQLFAEDGTVTPVTVIEAGPCVIVQRKTADKDGYEAVQIGLVDARSAKRANKAQRGHHEKAGVPPTRMLREFAIDAGSDPKPGDRVLVEIFKDIDRVDVIGVSKGKGFQGVMKRHNFGGGQGSHGSMFHRAPGSIGSSAFPSRVFKGMRGTGQMGAKRISAKNVKVVRLDGDKNLLLVRGAVPGAVGASVLIYKSQSGAKPAAAAAK